MMGENQGCWIKHLFFAKNKFSQKFYKFRTFPFYDQTNIAKSSVEWKIYRKYTVKEPLTKYRCGNSITLYCKLTYGTQVR